MLRAGQGRGQDRGHDRGRDGWCLGEELVVGNPRAEEEEVCICQCSP